jgi:hypothetical protein
MTIAARLGVSTALLIALLGGWLWGASGRWELDRALQVAQLRNDLIEAHASLLGARVDLCAADFVGARRHLASARAFIGRAGARRSPEGLSEAPQPRDPWGVGVELDQAQQLAARLNSHGQ